MIEQVDYLQAYQHYIKIFHVIYAIFLNNGNIQILNITFVEKKDIFIEIIIKRVVEQAIRIKPFLI